jgi:SAM-dependent methyltransferase
MRGAATVAFDRLAPTYDALVSGEVFQHQRAQTHAALRRWLQPGFRVLEIGCGTGLDTVFLAGLGARVVACDPSEEMLMRTRRRVASAGTGERVTMLSCGLQELPQFLGALDHREGFDAVVSNFGALNCAPSLDALGVVGRRHLRPGGAVIVGLIGRTCLWEILYFGALGERAKARRRQATSVEVPVAGINVPTFYHRRGDLQASLGESFRLDAAIGVGVTVPPPYLEPRWQQVPAPIRHVAMRVDHIAAGLPLINHLGDHSLTRWLRSREAHG